jgi:hypothetical protein
VPRLVLYGDNGKILFEGPISRQAVRAMALWLRRNAGVVRAAAATVRAVRQAAGLMAAAAPAMGPVRSRGGGGRPH